MLESVRRSVGQAARWKLILIPVLACVLILRITFAVGVFGQSDDDTATTEQSESLDVQAGTALKLLAQLRNVKKSSGNQLDELSLERVLNYDPFSLQGLLKERSEIPKTIDAMLSAGDSKDDEESADDSPGVAHEIKAIIDGPRGRAVLIGSRILRAGDTIEEGLRIVEIQTDGIIVDDSR